MLDARDEPCQRMIRPLPARLSRSSTPSSGGPSSMAAARRGRRAAAGHRRRRLGQDQHAGAPRRPSDRQRRRPAPHPAADLLAPRRRRDGAARRAHRRARCSGATPRRVADALDLGRHVPRHRRAAAARVCAAQIGLDPAFTIHDREDSADLMNLVRHELGFSQDREPLSDQGHLPRHLFARGQRRRRRSTRCCGSAFPGAPAGRRELQRLFAAYVEAKQAQNVLDYDDLLLYWAADDGRAGARRRDRRRASTMCWSTSTRTPTGCRPRSCWR